MLYKKTGKTPCPPFNPHAYVGHNGKQERTTCSFDSTETIR